MIGGKIDNCNELRVDAVHGTPFATSANSEPRPTEAEKADTFAEKVFPIDAQVQSSTKIKAPDEFQNNWN